jgi:hypothetical protein
MVLLPALTVKRYCKILVREGNYQGATDIPVNYHTVLSEQSICSVLDGSRGGAFTHLTSSTSSCRSAIHPCGQSQETLASSGSSNRVGDSSIFGNFQRDDA